MNNGIKESIRLLLLVILLSVVGKRIFFGFDLDEQYAISLIYRITRGDILIKEMWEPHQFSALTLALPVLLYTKIVGSTDYLVIFLRFFGVLIQSVVSVLSYISFRDRCGKKIALLSSSLIFLVLPKWIQSPEFTNMQIWLLILLLLAFVKASESKKYYWYIISGVLFSLLCLDYPSCALLVIVFVIFIGKDTKKQLCFICPSIVTVASIGIYLLVNVGSLSDILMYIKHIVSDEAHSAGVLHDTLMYLSEIPSLIMYLALYSVIGLIVAILIGIISKVKTKKLIVVLAMTIATGLSFIDQLRFWLIKKSPLVYPQYRFVMLFMLGVVVFALAKNELKNKWRFVFFLTYISTIVSFFLVLILTNLEMKSVFVHLLPACVLALIITRDYLTINVDNTAVKVGKAVATIIFACVLGVSIFSQIWLLRINNEGNYEDITLVRQKSLYGPSKYIYCEYMDGYSNNQNIPLIRDNIPAGSKVLLYGTNCIEYLAGDYDICTPSTISTPAFGKNIVDYYELNPNKFPEYIIKEKWMDETYRYYSSEFGDWYDSVIGDKIAESEFIEIYCVKSIY